MRRHLKNVQRTALFSLRDVSRKQETPGVSWRGHELAGARVRSPLLLVSVPPLLPIVASTLKT